LHIFRGANPESHDRAGFAGMMLGEMSLVLVLQSVLFSYFISIVWCCSGSICYRLLCTCAYTSIFVL